MISTKAPPCAGLLRYNQDVVYFFLFLFGLAIGSFMNVLALRYRGDRFLFDPAVIGGRSRCPHCGKTLTAIELIPVVSFFIQRGRCAACRSRIGFRYPLVELLSGAIFAAVPLRLLAFFGPGAIPAGELYVLSGLWILALEILLLIAYIDIRLQIIPDELTAGLGLVAVFMAVYSAGSLAAAHLSFLGGYAALFGLQQSFWWSRLAGAALGAGFFGAIILFYTYFRKGREGGMGMGDVKLGLPLGFLFGWPDILLLYAAAFVAGSAIGIIAIARKAKSMGSALPFAPFLAFGAAFTFFCGRIFLGWYFGLLGL